MSSMKSFKSRISQKGKNNQSRGNVSVSESVGEYNLKNLYTNAMDKIEFSLKREGNQVKVAPFELQVMNGTGTRIFLHLVSSKQDYFTIHPKKYILENGSSIKIDLKLNEISYVQLDDYQGQSFQLSWGKITQEQIAQKTVPKLTQAKVFKCLVKNKQILNEYLAKKTYQSRHKIENNLNVEKDDERGFLNAFDPSKAQQFARSGLNTSDIKTNKDLLNNRSSLLTKNILIPVAVISFIIGFISA